jgi:hypothetical protein
MLVFDLKADKLIELQSLSKTLEKRLNNEESQEDNSIKLEQYRQEISKISEPTYKQDTPNYENILSQSEKKNIMKNGMYLRNNIHKWLALQKIKINNNEVTLLGLLNDTFSSIKYGEERRDGKWLRTEAIANKLYINPGIIVSTGINALLQLDKSLLGGNLDKAFEGLLPNKYKDPEIFHDEFYRLPGSLFNRKYNAYDVKVEDSLLNTTKISDQAKNDRLNKN